MNLQEAIEEISEQIQIRLKDKQIEAILAFAKAAMSSCIHRENWYNHVHKSIECHHYRSKG